MEKEQPSIVLLVLPQQPDRFGGGRLHRVRDSRRLARACGGRRGLWPVRQLVGHSNWWARTVPLVVVRTYSKTWAMAALRLGLPHRAGAGRAGAGTRRPALPPGRPETGGGPLGAAVLASKWKSVSCRSSPNENTSWRNLAKMPVHVWPSQANFVLWRPERAARTRSVARPRGALGAGARHLEAGRASRAACGPRSAPSEENDRFLSGSGRGAPMSGRCAVEGALDKGDVHLSEPRARRLTAG